MSEITEETAIPETSEEIPIPVPPQENTPPDPNCSFYLKMKPFRTLKLAIDALLDPTFNNNNDGFGMIGADTNSLVISIKNNADATVALLLKSAGMIQFQNNAPPLVGMSSAPLRLISQAFPRYLDGDDDTVTVFHVQGTDRLQFDFGSVPRTGIWAKIIQTRDITIFPSFTVFTKITVPINDIRGMIDHILQEQDPSNDTVFVDWGEGVATFDIRSDRKWAYAVKNTAALKTFHGWFNWNYTRLVKEACILADKVTVYFLTDPEQHVLFRFHIGELGDLFLLDKALLVITDDVSAEEDEPDEDEDEPDKLCCWCLGLDFIFGSHGCIRV